LKRATPLGSGYATGMSADRISIWAVPVPSAPVTATTCVSPKQLVPIGNGIDCAHMQMYRYAGPGEKPDQVTVAFSPGTRASPTTVTTRSAASTGRVVWTNDVSATAAAITNNDINRRINLSRGDRTSATIVAARSPVGGRLCPIVNKSSVDVHLHFGADGRWVRQAVGVRVPACSRPLGAMPRRPIS
jgi:hypothetical protein